MNSIQNLFETIAKLLSLGDVAALVDTMETPTAVFHPSGLRPMRNASDVREFLETYLTQLREHGYIGTQVDVLSATPDGEDAVIALVQWRHLARGGTEISNWTATYYCVRSGDQWKTALVDLTDISGAKQDIVKNLFAGS